MDLWGGTVALFAQGSYFNHVSLEFDLQTFQL
jgi:hypothetical protein